MSKILIFKVSQVLPSMATIRCLRDARAKLHPVLCLQDQILNRKLPGQPSPFEIFLGLDYCTGV